MDSRKGRNPHNDEKNQRQKLPKQQKWPIENRPDRTSSLNDGDKQVNSCDPQQQKRPLVVSDPLCLHKKRHLERLMCSSVSCLRANSSKSKCFRWSFWSTALSQVPTETFVVLFFLLGSQLFTGFKSETFSVTTRSTWTGRRVHFRASIV